MLFLLNVCFPSRPFITRAFSSPSRHSKPRNPLFLTHNDFLDHLLQESSSIEHIKQIHSNITVTGNCSSAFLASRLVSSYARSGHLLYAQNVFETTPLECKRNFLLWNSIIRANVTHEKYKNVIDLYVRMRKFGALGDGFTFPLVIKACGKIGQFRLCKNVHAHVVETGYANRIHVANELMGMYARSGHMGCARQVFDRMSVRSQVSWNIMVSGYASNYNCDGAIAIFQRMEIEGLEPNLVTWTSLISTHARCGLLEETIELFGLMRMRNIGMNAEALAVVLSVCIDSSLFDKGMVIHGYAIKGGFEEYSFVNNALIHVYGKHGDVDGVRSIFMEMKNRTIVSWNAFLTSLSEAGLCDEALEVFLELERSDGCPMLRPNVVTWSTIIDGFASHSRGEESLELFRQMQLARVRANDVTISCVLSVCAELATLNLGRELHGHVIRASMDKKILVENGLVSMYTKCGCLKEGHLVFKHIMKKDVISWNSMITGYGMHGHGLDALEKFDQMVESGCIPDGVTFVAVLSACSHAGLVSEGRRLFDQMVTEYRIEPQMEHYSCMVDLLGRAGMLHEASQIVESMPMKPNACVWGALLNSCRMHKNSTEVAEAIGSNIFRLNTETSGSYMLLSNIYAASGRWDDSARVRNSARTRGLKKAAGQSWIEVKKNVHIFCAGNNVQKGLEEIYRVLKDLASQMEGEDYIHDMQ